MNNHGFIKILAGISTVIISGFFLINLKNNQNQSQVLSETIQSKPQIKTTTLFIAGDVMLSRNVGKKMREAEDPALPFLKVASKISESDLAFANLESPFFNEGPPKTEGLVFKAEPDSVEGLLKAGFDVLSAANNHSLDQGVSGIQFTADWLTSHGITPVGILTDCHLDKIVKKNGLSFGFLAYSYAATNDGGRTKDSMVCDANDLASVAEDIDALKPKVDYLVVSSHMGTEYVRNPTDFQTNFAHKAVDSGADLVVGNHPHWIQPVEQYKKGWIFYAMGNFVFDQMWSIPTRQGLSAQLTFKDKNLQRIDLFPVIIENYCCPRWANEDETKKILSEIDLTDAVLMNNN